MYRPPMGGELALFAGALIESKQAWLIMPGLNHNASPEPAVYAMRGTLAMCLQAAAVVRSALNARLILSLFQGE
jgi:hypothetical protein